MSRARRSHSLVVAVLAVFVAAAAISLRAASVLAAAPDPVPAPPGHPPAAVSFAKKPRRAQSRTVVPDEVLALLPWKGIYAAGGGSSSPAWRVVVTLEGDLRAGSNARPGSSSTAVLDKKRVKLPPETLAALVKLADRAWREKPPRPPPPADDYAEILVVADGEEVFVLDPKGPIGGGAAGELVARLQAEAAAR
jgi:hypothetical protein